MSAQPPAGDEELRELYAASYRRLVGVVGAVVGSQDAAEEAVQDAFVRLLKHWDKVSRYEDPEAWVRGVALRQASNSRRKAANALRAARRHGPPPDSPGLTGHRVDADRALAALPPPQRAVVVLHELGHDTSAIARALGVADGTVKSRLSRARATLAPMLKENVTPHV